MDVRAEPIRPDLAAQPAPLRVPPLSLYVHVPWCVRKCPYCDFNSHVADGGIPESDYCEALMADLETELPRVWGRRVGSIYFGGGTPSLFSAEAIDRLLSSFRALLQIAPGAEVSLEANPGTLDDDKAVELRSAGVNRISVGVQSFDDAMLAHLGRIHDGKQARRAVEQAVEAVGNVNIDLMHALPGQNPAGAVADARQALDLAPAHVSAYHLTIEPGTAFAQRPPPLPSHDEQADIADAAGAELVSNGYVQYEVSAYCLAGRQCAHNLNYWGYGDYLGIGCGAHGKITFPDRVERTERVRSPAGYIRKCLAGESAARSWNVPAEERIFEYALNAFRLRNGFEPACMAERCGVGIADIAPLLDAAIDRGLAERCGALVRASELGWSHMNELIGMFAAEQS